MQGIENITEKGLRKAIRVTGYRWVPYPPEVCFIHIASQLEAPAEWDLLIMHVWPLSSTRKKKGSLSRILINLGGQIHNCRAMVYQYQKDSQYCWFLTDYPRIWINWRLTSYDSGTRIGITVAREQTAVLLDDLWWKMRYQKQLGKDLKKMLDHLQTYLA